MAPLEGNPWFVATDVCRALGLTLAGGSTRHLTNLNQIDVRRGRADTGPQGGRPNALISEAGLYELIARSNKPEARAFKDWVFREVLPTIPQRRGACKTGGYVLQGADRATVGEGTVAEMPDVGGGLRVLYREGKLSLRGPPSAALSSLIAKSMVGNPHSSPFPNRGALFLTRAGRNQVLMASTKPAAKEFREWLAGEVVVSPRRLDRESPTDS